MPKYIAFLRAINVGGHIVKMDQLRTYFEALGFAKVETFIASGNVIFETESTELPALEKSIEDHLRQSLGYAVETFLRTEHEVSQVATYQPFPGEEIAKPKSLNVGFLKNGLDEASWKRIKELATELDDFHVNGREIYWLCRIPQNESKFSNILFEKIIKGKATFRGINTVVRLAAKYPVKKD